MTSARKIIAEINRRETHSSKSKFRRRGNVTGRRSDVKVIRIIHS